MTIPPQPAQLPLRARHVEPSALASADDDVRPSERLLDVALNAIAAARGISMEPVSARLSGPRWPDVWPGEHYRLLAGLVATLRPTVVVEIGTFQGVGSLALREALPEGGRITTFDVVPWTEITGSALVEDDFADGRLVQVLDDLTIPAVAERHRDLLEDAELIFADAAKDGQQERDFLALFERLEFRHAPVVVFDDIRLWNMLDIWRGIRRPKLDLTSFGHWSGTGLVDYA
ncbi:MAG: methyltransferase [Solirubrobacterales bacterium]|nr:methyltransferase [Solirubrobacterales bacterium]